MEKKYDFFSVPEDLDGKEIYCILKRVYGFSSSKIHSVKFDPDGIFLNGARKGVRDKVKTGDMLRILMDDSENRKDKIVPMELPIRVIFEDDCFLVIDKPSGMVSHPSKGHYFDSAANGVRFYLNARGEYSPLHLCGRLDRDTTGLLLFAKNAAAEWALERNGGFHKTYIGIAEGIPENASGEICIPMEAVRDADGILKMREAAETSAKTVAKTKYQVLQYLNGNTVFSAEIETGRMHQIRFHMSALGHPLLGDSLYGNGETDGMKRHALHAWKMVFEHPYLKRQIELCAEIPDDMKNFGVSL